jgi:hypothetical protein
VLAHFARDVELIAAIAGPIRRVTAIGPRAHDDSFAALQVQMTCDAPISIRWSVGSRSHSASDLQLSLLGERGTVVLRVRSDVDGEPMKWQLETAIEGESDQQPLESQDAPRIAIERFTANDDGTDETHRQSVSTWDDATRSMEVVDAVALSLEKSRTIDVFQQQLTERLAFRGTMAAMGCGLLLIGLAVVVAVALLGGIEVAAGQRLVQSWPTVLLAILAFFLFLQAVPLLAMKNDRRRRQKS